MDSKTFIYKTSTFLKKAKEALISVYSGLFKIFGVSGKKDKADEYGDRQCLDKKLVFSLSKTRIPSWKQIKYLKKFLSPFELWLLRASALILAASVIFLAARFTISHLQVAPAEGGEYTEGLVGSPKYINPLYSNLSDVDSDISRLIFSSLLKRGDGGKLVNDLAESYTVNEDGKTYIFKIKKDVKWHNGATLTADDILFTFSSIKDGRFKSPLKASFSGVEIEKINEENIKFILKEPYAAFPELLIFGIMPAELWYQISPNAATLAELNLKPVGSGPYKFDSLVKDKNGQIKIYKLTANENYYGSNPYITNMAFKFFPDFSEAVRALNDNAIDGIGYLPRAEQKKLAAKGTLNIYKPVFPHLAAVFFNQKASAPLKEKAVRQALALAIDKNAIIGGILSGDAYPIDGPILPSSFAYNANNKKYPFNMGEAAKILEGAGWKIMEVTEDDIKKAEADKENNDEKTKNAALAKLAVGAGKWREKDNKFLTIKLTTVEIADNAEVAETIRQSWEKLGIKTEMELIPPAQIRNNIIKTRNFSALLYGEVMGADPDPYAFWHSSQTGENGLNISDYANKEVDRLLEEGRLALNYEARAEKYKKFQEVITEELPAIFLYSPAYIYVQNKKIKGFAMENIFIPSDRFADISQWHIKTRKKLVW